MQNRGPSCSWPYGSWIYNYLCNQCLSSLTLWVRIPIRRGVFETALQGRMQDFKLGGGALKKIAPSGGRRENVWGISCEKSRFLRQKIIFFQILGGRAPGAPPPLDPPLHYVIKLVSYLRLVGGFLLVLLFPPPIRYNWNIIERSVTHHQPTTSMRK
jgi:hypothetical protein